MLRMTLAIALAAASIASAQAARKPNVVVIVADDLGYNDLSVQGSKEAKTPNIDAIAAAGTRFTNAYSSCPVCSPTRAGLMTGKYQQRFGHEQNPLPSADAIFGLPLDQKTMADYLKADGYHTGFVGKWHLGNEPPFYPTKRGFDEYFGFLGGLHKYVNNAAPEEGLNAIRRNDVPVGVDKYLTDAWSDEAVAFIDRNRDRPFFLYLPYNAVHSPQQVPPKYRERFADIKDDRRMRMCAMLAAEDDGVGRVTESLKKLGIEDDTLVIFFSDNGGPPGNGTNNAPFRGYKGETLEGGIRVPFLVKWTGHLPAGKVDDRIAITLDVLPTALAAAGAPMPAGLDGVNLLPFVNGKTGAIHESLFWRFGPRNAARSGQWKMQWNEGERRKLYDLSKDVTESTDVTSANPDVAKKMSADWDAWNATLAKPLWPGRLEGGGRSDDGTTTRPAVTSAEQWPRYDIRAIGAE